MHNIIFLKMKETKAKEVSLKVKDIAYKIIFHKIKIY